MLHNTTGRRDGQQGIDMFSLRQVAVLVALFLATIVYLHDISAFAWSDDATFDEDSYEVTFHANGAFIATCRCVSVITYCSKLLRAVAATKTGDKQFGIEEWELHGVMKSGARFDLRQACFFDDKKQDVQFCCSKGKTPNFSVDKEFYSAKLKKTEQE